MYINSFNPFNDFSNVGTIIISILEMRKLKHRGARQGVTCLKSQAGKWQCQDLNPGRLVLGITLPPAYYITILRGVGGVCLGIFEIILYRIQTSCLIYP